MKNEGTAIYFSLWSVYVYINKKMIYRSGIKY